MYLKFSYFCQKSDSHEVNYNKKKTLCAISEYWMDTLYTEIIYKIQISIQHNVLFD